MNVFNGIGRMTRDVELIYTDKGTAVARFGLAINRKYDRDKADFPNCVAFGKVAELIGEYVKKGHRIGVTGRIQTGSYEKDGQRVYTTDIIVEDVEFLESRNEQSRNTGQFQKPQQTPFEQSGEKIDTESADLPF